MPRIVSDGVGIVMHAGSGARPSEARSRAPLVVSLAVMIPHQSILFEHEKAASKASHVTGSGGVVASGL